MADDDEPKKPTERAVSPLGFLLVLLISVVVGTTSDALFKAVWIHPHCAKLCQAQGEQYAAFQDGRYNACICSGGTHITTRPTGWVGPLGALMVLGYLVTSERTKRIRTIGARFTDQP